MHFDKIEEFLDETLSYVKFVLDRYEIKLELKDHMMDKLDYYIESGHDGDEAERLTIKDMGDPKEIGVELNKQHNPIIGWIWRISRVAVILFIIINIFTVGSLGLISIFSTSEVSRIPKEDILYRINLDEKVQIDNRIIKITNIIYEKNGDMNIFYKDYEKSILGGGWSLGYLGTIKDDLGNEYRGYSGSSSGGIVTKSRKTIKDFSKDANTLIIDYDLYNRKYRIEIPLKTGEDNE